MALKEYQSVVTLDRLYEIKMLEGGKGLGEALKPRITAKGGSIDIYFMDATVAPASLAEMSLVATDASAQAIESILCYMAVTENAATVGEVVITGIELVADLGPIS